MFSWVGEWVGNGWVNVVEREQSMSPMNIGCTMSQNVVHIKLICTSKHILESRGFLVQLAKCRV